jgi:hypothetical protein
MGRLKVERLGGFGGFGLPGSHLRSRGEVERSQLAAADREQLDALFDSAPAGATPMPDGFVYRLTRQTAGGEQTIDVVEAQVPIAIRTCVSDELV